MTGHRTRTGAVRASWAAAAQLLLAAHYKGTQTGSCQSGLRSRALSRKRQLPRAVKSDMGGNESLPLRSLARLFDC